MADATALLAKREGRVAARRARQDAVSAPSASSVTPAGCIPEEDRGGDKLRSRSDTQTSSIQILAKSAPTTSSKQPWESFARSHYPRAFTNMHESGDSLSFIAERNVSEQAVRKDTVPAAAHDLKLQQTSRRNREQISDKHVARARQSSKEAVRAAEAARMVSALVLEVNRRDSQTTPSPGSDGSSGSEARCGKRRDAKQVRWAERVETSTSSFEGLHSAGKQEEWTDSAKKNGLRSALRNKLESVAERTASAPTESSMGSNDVEFKLGKELFDTFTSIFGVKADPPKAGLEVLVV